MIYLFICCFGGRVTTISTRPSYSTFVDCLAPQLIRMWICGREGCGWTRGGSCGRQKGSWWKNGILWMYGRAELNENIVNHKSWFLSFQQKKDKTIEGNPGTFLDAWCGAQVGNWRPVHVAWRMLFFIFVIGTAMFEFTFGGCKNSKPMMYFFPGFHPWKGRLGIVIQDGPTKNFEIRFFGYLAKNVVLNIFYFSLLSFVPVKLHVNPKKNSF